MAVAENVFVHLSPPLHIRKSSQANALTYDRFSASTICGPLAWQQLAAKLKRAPVDQGVSHSEHDSFNRLVHPASFRMQDKVLIYARSLSLKISRRAAVWTVMSLTRYQEDQ